MQQSTVEIDSGRLCGVDLGQCVAWRGIPYARPPLGEYRLRAPRAPLAWAGVRDASRPGPIAMQPRLVGDVPVPGPISEDCLTVNVCAPRPERRPAPVLVWLHSGGYLVGSGAALPGDGATLVAKGGMIVVTANYRLGPFGFLDLGRDEPDSGACGLLDQIAVLRWVHRNIAAFGGDPTRITLFGGSAGAKSVTNLIASPSARGLFGRAVCASGGQYVADREQQVALRGALLAKLGIDPSHPGRIRACAAGAVLAAATELLDGWRALWLWRPGLHPDALPEMPLQMIRRGTAAPPALIVGGGGDEASLFEHRMPGGAEQAPVAITRALGSVAARRILGAYGTRDADERLRAVFGDERYGIPSVQFADAHSAHAPTWRYLYAGGYPDRSLPLGGHGADFSMLWRGTGASARRLRSGLAQMVHDGCPPWPSYRAPARRTLLIDDAGTTVTDDPRAEERQAWQGLDWQPDEWWQRRDQQPSAVVG